MFILILNNIVFVKWIFINLDNMIYCSSSRKVYQDIFDWLYILFDLVYEICNEFYVLSFLYLIILHISIFALYCYSILFRILSDITRIRRNSLPRFLELFFEYIILFPINKKLINNSFIIPGI